MSKRNPWTNPDPQPGDFDADIAAMGPDDVQVVEAGSGAKVVEIQRPLAAPSASQLRVSRSSRQTNDS